MKKNDLAQRLARDTNVSKAAADMVQKNLASWYAPQKGK